MACQICTHVKQDGYRCGSPALRGTNLCFHHDRFCKRHKVPSAPRRSIGREGEQAQPALRNLRPFQFKQETQAILTATRFVMRELAAKRIKPTQARTLLYALRSATTNLR